MLFLFILLSFFCCSSIHAEPFINVMYSDGLDDTACNGTSTWSNWDTLLAPKTVDQFYMTMAMIKLNSCPKQTGMQVRIQSGIPMENFSYRLHGFLYFYRSLLYYLSYISQIKLQVRYCCGNTQPTPIQNSTCQISLPQLPLVAYKEVYRRRLYDESTRICTGVMLDSFHVLMQASCANKTNRISNVILSHTNNQPIEIEIKNLTIHPEYDQFTNKNNLAIIQLAHEYNIIGAICLPTADFTRSHNQTIVTTVETYNITSPYKFLETQIEIVNNCPEIDQDHELCIIDTEASSGTTSEMIFDNQQVLIGISFLRQNSFTNNSILVYSRIEPFVSWIYSIINKN